jgi:hypothetical protein
VLHFQSSCSCYNSLGHGTRAGRTRVLSTTKWPQWNGSTRRNAPIPPSSCPFPPHLLRPLRLLPNRRGVSQWPQPLPTVQRSPPLPDHNTRSGLSSRLHPHPHQPSRPGGPFQGPSHQPDVPPPPTTLGNDKWWSRCLRAPRSFRKSKLRVTTTTPPIRPRLPLPPRLNRIAHTPSRPRRLMSSMSSRRHANVARGAREIVRWRSWAQRVWAARPENTSATKRGRWTTRQCGCPVRSVIPSQRSWSWWIGKERGRR